MCVLEPVLARYDMVRGGLVLPLGAIDDAYYRIIIGATWSNSVRVLHYYLLLVVNQRNATITPCNNSQ